MVSLSFYTNEQVAPKGINHNLRSSFLSFSCKESKIRQIDDFLNQHGGYKAFLWTPYQSKQVKFRCYEWNLT
ncbi:phage tail protein [Otariodibacter sp.]|uniref:phage tail protein n=1 Tax=Otariodibacter sp. TaxID=3030919 RepID=UPI002610AEF0|nr:phage tail protein [Otariodibacter sp.]